MDIKINESWSISGENYNWVVRYWYDGKDRDGNHKKHSKESYYSSLEYALKVICEKSAIECATAEEILTSIEDFKLLISAALERAGIH